MITLRCTRVQIHVYKKFTFCIGSGWDGMGRSVMNLCGAMRMLATTVLYKKYATRAVVGAVRFFLKVAVFCTHGTYRDNLR